MNNLVERCPGQVRIRETKNWYVKPGETAQQATYCDVCVKNGCIGCDATEMKLVECKMANCDCPNPAAHKELNLVVKPAQKVTCDKCAKRQFGYGTIAHCHSCGWQIDMSNTLCDHCSEAQQRCHGCGKK